MLDSLSPIDSIVQQRREKIERLIKEGRFPYGRRFTVSHSAKKIHDQFGPVIVKPGESGVVESEETVQTAGRLMTRRDMGKLCFAHIQDLSGKIQLKISVQDIGQEAYQAFNRDVDLGDILGVSGPVCRTKTGELSIHLKNYELLSKSIRPWPEKFHGLTDTEARSRQRELDLGTNPE